MAYQVSKPVTKPAPGDAPNTGAPGPTPPPVDVVRSRSFGRENYGSNAYDGRVVTDPGERVSSPLADALEAKQHGDSGALTLEHIRQHGTARDSSVDLASSQTRPYTSEQKVASVHGQTRRNSDAGSPGGTVPSATGASVKDDFAARRSQRD